LPSSHAAMSLPLMACPSPARLYLFLKAWAWNRHQHRAQPHPVAPTRAECLYLSRDHAYLSSQPQRCPGIASCARPSARAQRADVLHHPWRRADSRRRRGFQHRIGSQSAGRDGSDRGGVSALPPSPAPSEKSPRGSGSSASASAWPPAQAGRSRRCRTTGSLHRHRDARVARTARPVGPAAAVPQISSLPEHEVFARRGLSTSTVQTASRSPSSAPSVMRASEHGVVPPDEHASSLDGGARGREPATSEGTRTGLPSAHGRSKPSSPAARIRLSELAPEPAVVAERMSSHLWRGAQPGGMLGGSPTSRHGIAVAMCTNTDEASQGVVYEYHQRGPSRGSPVCQRWLARPAPDVLDGSAGGRLGHDVRTAGAVAGRRDRQTALTVRR